MNTATEGLQIHLLARVGDSEVLNEIATIEQTLEVEAITEGNRKPGDSAAATARIQIDMAAALRACADEIDKTQGVVREPQPEERLAAIAELLGALDLNGKTTAPGTAWGSILRDALKLAQEGAEAPPLTAAKIEAGVAAALATLQDRETGAGSDLEQDIYREPDEVYVEIHGNVDLPQLVREIAEATR
jgi:hypothetical protein